VWERIWSSSHPRGPLGYNRLWSRRSFGKGLCLFTGIVIDVGRLIAVRPAAYGARLSVRPSRSLDVKVSDSVAVNGVCLTLCADEGGALLFDCVRETLDRTTLGRLSPGDGVNLELALAAGERIGGHFVQGHIDGACPISAIERHESDRTVRVACPPELLRMVVEKGSVAIDGISLTVASVSVDSFAVKIVPYTWDATNLRDRQVGDAVNVEVDILAKYVAALTTGSRPAGLTVEALRAAGF